MPLVPTARARLESRILPIAVLAAFLALAFVGAFAPVASAGPAAPHFGPSFLVDRPPAYTAANPSIAIGSDGVAYLAFAGWGGTVTQSDVFFTKSSDGRTWSTPSRVNKDPGAAAQSDPSLALDRGNNISIAWTDNRNGNNDVFFSKSTDGGGSFSPDVAIIVAANAQSQPAIVIDPVNTNLIHAVWTDQRNAGLGPDIFYANSTDGGLSFNPSSRVINNDVGAVEQTQPAIAVAPTRDVYVVWTDGRNGPPGPDIYFSKSSDLGATWSLNAAVNDDVGNAARGDPTVAVNETGAIFAAWTDSRNLNNAQDIYATRSTNAGFSFVASVRVNDDGGPAVQFQPSLAERGGKIQVAWTDLRTSGSTSWDIYTASSTDGLVWSTNSKVNDDTTSAVQANANIAIDGAGDVFAAWLDTRAFGQDVYATVFDVVSPVASAGASVTVDQGSAATFDGSASSDNLGIASYAWDFGDGSSATGGTGSHVYSTPGTFSATLTVWDYSGNAASATRTVTVRDTQSPVPRGGGDRAIEEGQPLFFDASASTDNVGVVSYAWTFGDGSVASTATASHIYARPGVYNVTLKVTDAAGNTGTVAFNVTVQPNALLGLIQILEGIVAILAVAIAILGWMVFGRGRRERQPPGSPPYPAPPRPREADPLDMQLPPPPRGP